MFSFSIYMLVLLFFLNSMDVYVVTFCCEVRNSCCGNNWTYACLVCDCFRNSQAVENRAAHRPYAFCTLDLPVTVVYICRCHSNPFHPIRFAHQLNHWTCNMSHATLSMPYLINGTEITTKKNKQLIKYRSKHLIVAQERE